MCPQATEKPLWVCLSRGGGAWGGGGTEGFDLVTQSKRFLLEKYGSSKFTSNFKLPIKRSSCLGELFSKVTAKTTALCFEYHFISADSSNLPEGY